MVVRRAIHFDHQIQLPAIKIQDIFIQRLLTIELIAAHLPTTRLFPQ
jgi:hypothetical protein